MRLPRFVPVIGGSRPLWIHAREITGSISTVYSLAPTLTVCGSRSAHMFTFFFRSGAVEAVASSLARGRAGNALQLPNIQCMIIHYARVYAAALRDAGIQPPFAIYVSLAGVKDMRLLQDFIGTAFVEDLPYGLLSEDLLCFGEAIFDEVPKNDNESAKKLLPFSATSRIQLSSRHRRTLM
jgi:hypothetical protein